MSGAAGVWSGAYGEDICGGTAAVVSTCVGVMVRLAVCKAVVMILCPGVPVGAVYVGVFYARGSTASSVVKEILWLIPEVGHPSL